MDVSNPALAIDCPRCGLRTARFMEYCRNCGFALWPSGPVATAAFRAWRDHDPERAPASRFDLAIPIEDNVPVVDFEEQAHRLGIHVFPSSSYPFPIAIGIGILLLGLALSAVPAGIRIAIAAVGALILLYGVAGWVLVEDVRYFPGEPFEIEHGAGSSTETTH